MFPTMPPLLLVSVLLLAAACPAAAVRVSPQPRDTPLFAGLRPQDSEWREVRALDGVWQFRLAPTDDPEVGFREKWYAAPLAETGDVLDMPVPASYNDITELPAVRDHLGWAWYSTEAWAPRGWQAARTVLRFGSAHYTAVVYVNGQQAVTHSGGHLPFAVDVSSLLQYGQRNLLTVAVNNTLTDVTVPQGETVRKQNSSNYVYPAGYTTLDYHFDFFNYAGIHRPVLLCATPLTFVEDVLVTTQLRSDGGADVSYSVTVGTTLPGGDAADVNVTLLAPDGSVAASVSGVAGTVTLPQPQLWWPYLMDAAPGRQYTLQVQMTATSGAHDVYRQRFGVREFAWNASSLTVNGRPIYIRGFGKHEDSDIRGKGLDLPTVVKDFNLIEWVGANCFRTSHYPYAEEIMDAADARGILVIDEVPAVSLDYSGTGDDDRLITQHLTALREVIGRDKNRPGVLMWSLSNEAKTTQPEAVAYYQRLVDFVRTSDGTRPVTAVLNSFPDTELIASLLDVVCVNRYFGWYSDTGHTEIIQQQAEHFFTLWRSTFGKPVVNSEYGADTVAGMHRVPSFVFTEEYQVALMASNFAAFEKMRSHGWFIGEMIWNFADFMTKQDTTRVVGNKKGIFTRQRQPKLSAHVLRARYWRLAQQTERPEVQLPADLMFSAVFTGLQAEDQCPAAAAQQPELQYLYRG